MEVSAVNVVVIDLQSYDRLQHHASIGRNAEKAANAEKVTLGFEDTPAFLKARIHNLEHSVKSLNEQIDGMCDHARLGRMICKMPRLSTLSRAIGGGYKFEVSEFGDAQKAGEYGTYQRPEDALSAGGLGKS